MSDEGIGRRVIMCGDHPWAGHTGEIVRWGKTLFGIRPVVRLDNGMESFAMKPEHMKLIGELFGIKGRRKRG